MKEVTTTKYECSDGTVYENKAHAQARELKLWFTEKTVHADEDGNPGRLTSAGILDFIGANPDEVITRLQED